MRHMSTTQSGDLALIVHMKALSSRDNAMPGLSKTGDLAEIDTRYVWNWNWNRYKRCLELELK